MSTNIVVPELGESIVEATVIRWFKSEGDSVKIGEALLELETEKANFEIAAEKPGIIKTILKRDNDDVEVGEVLGVLEEADASSAVQAEVVKEEIDEQPQPKEEVLEKITPVARRLAEEFDVDLSKVEATGTSGRITKEDVERYIQMEVEESEIEASSVEPIHKAPAVITPTLAIARDVREERIKMSRRRRTIARRMLEATQTTAMLTTFNEVDMSAVMELRKRRKESFIERYGVNLGLNSFFVKASIGALKEFPPVNGEIDGDYMILKYYYDIGVAIGASEGLVVPVLKNADSMSFAEIEKKIKEFAVKAEENTLALEDIMGGTFTITNGGVFGSLMSTPILNPPQVGILGLHKIEQRPIVINGELEIRPMMYVALSYDHRIVDGREAVQFLVRLKELIQDPESLLLEG
jgi:2-oxoglutarate dehydrogenase E2 component (dihydrolipoamide succinyltransferase)